MINDHIIWFRNIPEESLRKSLERLRPEENVYLEAGGVVGRWRRMKPYPDGRATPGIRPDGEMKRIWNEWFRTRRGDTIDLRIVQMADDYLAAQTALFSEWSSPEDEKAFRDL
jgi:hypothetical protein